MMAETPSGYGRRAWQVGIIVALLAAGCLWISFQFIEPVPSRQIVIASGPEGGLFHRHAQRYRESMERHGVAVIKRMTEGAGENMRLLSDPSSGVDIGFVQGGQAGGPEAKGVVMIVSLHYQPLWIFVQADERFDPLAALAGRTVAVGMTGSGTIVLATPLLAASGVTENNAKLAHMPVDRTRSALHTGEVDAAFLVGGVRSAAVTEALTDPTLELVSLAHANAYPQRYPYLSRRTLYSGAISFAPVVPARDIALITTEAMLAARDTLHPAIVNLLLETMRDEHEDQEFFEAPGEFPNVEQVDLPVSQDAMRHKRFGPSLLYRYLPFWVATFVERFIIIVLPLMLVVLPVIHCLPQVLNWRARSRIYRWYGELRLLERDVEIRRGTLPIGKRLQPVTARHVLLASR
jgi:TRAP-type uncharacterized transport system substrate-binding protein